MALILSAAIEFVLISEFSVIFRGPPSLPGSVPAVLVDFGGVATERGLSLLPFVVG